METLTPAQRELYEWLVQYIQTAQHAPSIRQMMKAMNLKSPAPVQSRLERLRAKGYIDWTEGKARTIRILNAQSKGLPVEGAIAAGGLVEPFTDAVERLELNTFFMRPDYFALLVTGDSMVEDSIIEGDYAIVRRPSAGEEPKNGEIVAARVPEHGTTLKHFYREGDRVILRPANSAYAPIKVEIEAIEIQGILVGVWRNYRDLSSGARQRATVSL